MMQPIHCLVIALACAAIGSVQAEGLRQAIHFPKGESSATLENALARGDTDRYELVARKGQTMTVKISAEEDNAAITIYRPGAKVKPEDDMTVIEGATLAGAGEGEDATRWSGKLPDSGKYLIEVGATRGGASYRMTVGIK
jgi:hypothetical protein